MPFQHFLSRTRTDEQAPYVFLETRRPGAAGPRSMWFSDPVAELTLHPGDDATAFFDALEAQLDAGHWVAGHLSYEAGYLLERSLQPLAARLPAERPLAWFGVFDAPLEGHGHTDGLDVPPAARIGAVSMAHDLEAYGRAFDQVHEAIARGDIYQLNFTTRARFQASSTPEQLYLSLRHRQKAAYSACIFDGEQTVISLSPERFLTRKGDRVIMQPMKGTAPRGRSETEDAQLQRWLHEDSKNRAENVMIVDMVRNDLGRVSLEGTVVVDELFEVEPLETAWQMTSTVSAQLRPDTRWVDLMRAVFPCASITGAPKIRAMEMIADLETEPRGVYTGAIGFVSPQREASFSVAIRTAVVDASGAGELGLGSGIVFDSIAASEYEECLLKGRFLIDMSRPFQLRETMRVEDGQVFLRAEHMERLQRSAAEFGFACDRVQLDAALDALCADGHTQPRRVRLLLDPDGGIAIDAEDMPHTPESGWRVALWPEPVDPSDVLLYHKTTLRAAYDQAREEALANGFDEVLFVNDRGELTEGAISNLFVEIDGVTVTPPVSAGLLAGTLREAMLAKGECVTRTVGVDDLTRATAVFMGNSVRGLIPATIAAPSLAGPAGAADVSQGSMPSTAPRSKTRPTG